MEGVSIVIYDGEFDNGGKDDFLKKLTELNALDGMLHLLESQDRVAFFSSFFLVFTCSKRFTFFNNISTLLLG